MKLFLTVKEASAAMGITDQAVYALIRGRRLSARKFGPRSIRIPSNAIARFQRFLAKGSPKQEGR